MAKLLSDKNIREYVEKYNMITPFAEKTKRDGLFSFGLGSFGYDARLDGQYKVLSFKELERYGMVLDTKNEQVMNMFKGKNEAGGRIEIPAHSVAVLKLVEHFNMPNHVQAYSHFGKSSYGRAGIIPNICPIDAGYSGAITFSVNNFSPVPIVLYANEGIVQLSFWAEEEDCEESYAVDGKYMNSTGLTIPKFNGIMNNENSEKDV